MNLLGVHGNIQAAGHIHDRLHQPLVPRVFVKARHKTPIQSRASEEADKNLERFVSTFNDMVASVKAREEALARQLNQLKIEIDHQHLHTRLAEVTETDFFKNLQARAGDMRHRVRGTGTASSTPDLAPPGADSP